MKRANTLILIIAIFLLGACSDSISPTVEDFSIKIQDDGKLIVDFKTNLPDGVEMDVSIRNPTPDRSGFGAGAFDDPSGYPKVKNGRLTGWFSSANKYGMDKGNYTILISILPNQAALGEGNIRLAGEYVTTSAISKGFELRLQEKVPDVLAQQ